MVKITRYEFDPSLFLRKLKPSSVLIPPVHPYHLHRTNRLPCSLRKKNDLNWLITTSDHVWDPMCITYGNFITSYDNRIVYQEDCDL